MDARLQMELPRDPSAARQARQALAERFAGELELGALDTAKLLATELVNNAVLHGQGAISLGAELDGDRLRVDVVDEGSGFAHEVRETGFSGVGGRGLEIVDAESSRWGLFEGTTHVWFEIERSGPRLGSE